MRTLTVLSTLAAVTLGSAALAEPVMSFFELKPNRLNGKQESLSGYKGKVLLVVNTASECGFTPQYAGLEKLHQEYKDKGVVVMGFPSNDFGGQEPGTSEQIAQFCERKFKVTFPMFEKVKTKGEGRSPVYEFLARKHGEPQWNFHKYVVGKDGQVKAAFPSSVKPDSAELKKALDGALKE
jgi:glutathione peroxidase